MLIACGSGESLKKTSGGNDNGGENGEGGDPNLMLPSVEQALSAGTWGACWIDAQGALACRNGSADSTSSEGPQQGMPTGKFRFVSVGNAHACAIREDQSVVCWGAGATAADDCMDDAFGQECGQAIAPSGQFVEVAAGVNHSCGIRPNGALECWGFTQRAFTVPIDTFVHVGLGEDYGCALTKAGAVLCWGDSFSMVENDAPKETGFKQLSVGPQSACALDEQGKTTCWQFPAEPPSVPLKSISVGTEHLCGVSSDGSVVCVGVDDAEPLRVPPPTGTFARVAAGPVYSCAQRDSGEVECWGSIWGNGSGSELCSLDSTQLSGSVAGAPYMMTLPLSWFDGSTDTPQWRFVYKLGDPARLDGAVFRGAGMLGFNPMGLRYSLSNGQSVTGSAWLELGSSANDPGALYCSSAASITRKGDEAQVKLDALRTLGSCPGKAVTGSLDVCFKPGGCTNITGTLEGKNIDAEIGNFEANDQDVRAVSNDGAYLVLKGPDNVDASAPQGAITWGLLFTDPEGPQGGAVYCVGAGSEYQAMGTGLEQESHWKLKALSKLGRCMDAQPSTDMLSGCFR